MEKNLDEKVMADVLMSADSRSGETTHYAKPEEQPEGDKPILKIQNGKITEKLGKYSKEIFEDVKKHPQKYSVTTSKGRMNLRDAMMKGWDPRTNQFSGEDKLAKKEELLSQVSESDRKRIEELTDPATAQIPEAEANTRGLDPNSPMIKRGTPTAEAPAAPQEADMSALSAMLGGKMGA